MLFKRFSKFMRKNKTKLKPSQVPFSPSKAKVVISLSEAKTMCPFLKTLPRENIEEVALPLSQRCPVVNRIDGNFDLLNDLKGTTLQEDRFRTYEAVFTSNINKLKEEGNYRYFATLERHCGSFPRASYRPPAQSLDFNTKDSEDTKLKEVKIFCSNDYLGMGQHEKVLAASVEAIRTVGCGAGGTRNISGTTIYHVKLEEELKDLHTKTGALVCSSGYVANEAALSVLGQVLPGAVLLSDAGNHASMIAGIRHSRLDKLIYNHNNMKHLEELLKSIPYEKPKVIIFESVYSMSGGICPMKEVVYLAKKYNALTFCDEVHAVGMYGQRGAGIAEKEGLQGEVDIISGTLGKAYGVFGGYVVGSKNYIDCVRSFASGFIFTTAIPPVVAAGALASISHLKSSQEERRLQQLRAQQLREIFKAKKVPFIESPSHIVPVFVGNPVKCKALTDHLLNDFGIYLQPINYPTVPRGTERIRVTPGPLHSEKDLEDLATALDTLFNELQIERKFVEKLII